MPSASGSEPDGGRFAEEVLPVLEGYCHACHGNGMKKGGLALDGIEEDAERLRDRNLWWGVLKNVRAGIMPPADRPQPSPEERRLLEAWIKGEAFGIDPDDPDPGRTTVRRLNRVEYRNTIRDLLGVDYDTTSEFPPDDTGHGFDNIGDVLTLSPLLLEKYLAAAEAIVPRAIPLASKAVAERVIPGREFRSADAEGGREDKSGPRSLSYYEPSAVSTPFRARHDGRYRLVLDLSASERFVDGVFDANKCRLIFKVDGEELFRREFVRQNASSFRFEPERELRAGDHVLSFEVEPLTPDAPRVRSLALQVRSVTAQGPLDEGHWVRPADHARVFPGEIPDDPDARREYAREWLARFAGRAFRRPVDGATLDRLLDLATPDEGESFEAGIARGVTAILTSPRFLFREEGAEPRSSDRYPLVDEYALASRLSYLLWSSMPDEELFRLAGVHRLRENLRGQVDRMLADPRSSEFFRNFVGQWLQARDIETVLINASAVAARDVPPDPEADKLRARFRELNRKGPENLTDAEKEELKAVREKFFQRFRRFRGLELTGDLRRSMRRETEMLFEYVVREGRSLLELLDADYTFLDARLAKHYGIEGVEGDEMRRVPLPPESPRGGLLTQGTVLIVTSNPDRTSPVKRGLFLLENILGSPPAPPPPDIPPLKDGGRTPGQRTPSLRESLEMHRAEAMCFSCHARMDPLGLALENFNALGRWREKERETPIDASGRLITGEPFGGIRELKRVLVESRRVDFYRCLSEKLLTYALGRGLETTDVQAVDDLVARLEGRGGDASALLMGIVESPPFQRRRRSAEGELGKDSAPDAGPDSEVRP